MRKDSKFQTVRFECEVTSQLCELINTPRSLTVYLMIKHRLFDDLVSLDINPTDYFDSETFADDYLVTKILSKSPSLDTTYDRENQALESFFRGEELCKKTNQRFNKLSVEETGLLHKVSAWCQRILGPCDRRALDSIENSFRHGPGATYTLPGTGSVPSEKFRSQPSLTIDLLPFARSICGPRWSDSVNCFDVVEGNRFVSVPKTAKTNRGICIEPTLNVYSQLGVGAYFKKRLSHYDCNLRDQSFNQYLAKQAIDMELATIDLSLASDSLSFSVVDNVLPYKWAELLTKLRSQCTVLPDGTVIELEKFSSMGNGFTFELETLIFLAIVNSIVPEEYHHVCSVYGDDIIVPQAYANAVISGLEFFGFIPNREKTYLAGRFFESCGADFFDGQNVRPFYLRRQPSDQIPYALQVCNALRLYSERRSLFGYCDSRYRKLWLWCKSFIPRNWLNPVPKSLGDQGLIVSHLELHRFPRSHHEIEGRYLKYMRVSSKRKRSGDLALLLYSFGKSTDFSCGRELIRGIFGRPVATRGPVRVPDGLEWM